MVLRKKVGDFGIVLSLGIHNTLGLKYVQVQ